MNRIRMLPTMLLAATLGSALAQDARADIRGPFPGVDSGIGVALVISIVVATIVSAAIAGFASYAQEKALGWHTSCRLRRCGGIHVQSSSLQESHVIRAKMLPTLLLAVILGTVFVGNALADILPLPRPTPTPTPTLTPAPAPEKGMSVVVISVVGATIASAAVAGFVVLRRKKP